MPGGMAALPDRPLPDRRTGEDSSAALAYAEIKRRILDNSFQPGRSVSVKETALALGMSRTPIRYALIRLAEERLVALVPRHGFRVLPVAPEDMREIYAILGKLEQLAIEAIGSRPADAAASRPLLQAAKDMQAAIDADDLDRWAEADARFHRRLFELSGSRRLHDLAEGFWNQVHRARLLTLRLRPRPDQSTREHLRLAMALADGDGQAALAIHRAQRLRSAAELVEILRRHDQRDL